MFPGQPGSFARQFQLVCGVLYSLRDGVSLKDFYSRMILGSESGPRFFVPRRLAGGLRGAS